MSIINHFQHLILTDDQVSAVQQIEQFLQSDDDVFILKGYAGTGKTTLLKGITKYLQSVGKNCQLMAPTGRAAMILGQKTAKEASTIHRYIYSYDDIKERKEHDSYFYEFALAQNPDADDTIYFVDEASMIGNSSGQTEFLRFGSGMLLNDLLSFAFNYECARKIIFIGDTAQLPPVDMKDSPALSSKYLTDRGYGTKEFTIRQVYRQSEGSGILNTATGLRDALERGVFNSFYVDFESDDIHDLDELDLPSVYTQAAKRDGIEHTIIVTHSNRLASQYNQIVRELRFKTTGHIPAKPKDRLLVTKNNYQNEVELFNGMIVDIHNVGGIIREERIYFRANKGKPAEEVIRWRAVSVEVNTPDGIVILNTTILEDFLFSKERDLTRNQQIALYVDFKNRMQKVGIKQNSEAFKKALASDKYYHALQAKFGYAITCHKSQGGEWKNVIVDFNVFIGKTSPSYYRWAYTAITRASENLYAIGLSASTPISKMVYHPITKASKLKGNYCYHNPDNLSLYFIEWQKRKLRELLPDDIIHLVIPHQYKQEFEFTSGTEKSILTIDYNKEFFKKESLNIKSSTSESFEQICRDIVSASLESDPFKFNPKFDFQELLNQYIVSHAEHLDISINNVIQRDYSDCYFFETNATCAAIEFWFDKNQIYTKALPKSTLGTEDEKLSILIHALQTGD